jgi:hypothetical protein
MLHGAAGFHLHDVAEAEIKARGGAVGDGEVAARVIAGEEDVDLVYPALNVIGVWREGQAAIGRDVQRHLDEVWEDGSVSWGLRRSWMRMWTTTHLRREGCRVEEHLRWPGLG